MSSRIVVPGGRIVSRVDPRHRIGVLAHIEPAHPKQPWAAGVPSGSILNLAGPLAEVLTGGPASAFPIADGLTGHGGVVERTGKGGIHFIVSRVADETGMYWRADTTAAIRQWLSDADKRGRTTFVGAAMRVTRAGSGTADQVIRLGQSTTTSRAGVAVGSSVAYGEAAPTTNRLGYGSFNSPGAGVAWIAVNGASSFVADPFIIAGPITSSHLHTVPSWILYELWVEDCTASGRTWEQARDEFTADAAKKFATIWADDTWTPPSIAMPG